MPRSARAYSTVGGMVLYWVRVIHPTARIILNRECLGSGFLLLQGPACCQRYDSERFVSIVLSHIPQHFAMTVAAANDARITAPSYETNVGHFCPGKWLRDEIEHAIIHEKGRCSQSSTAALINRRGCLVSETAPFCAFAPSAQGRIKFTVINYGPKSSLSRPAPSNPAPGGSRGCSLRRRSAFPA